MWRIESLRLKNFVHIYSGMNKTEIFLDLSKTNKKINIFIGKMGSGKSSILGHLQPFATYGSLDVRNQSDLIIPEEDGVKEIVFIKGANRYEISHIYNWNKNTKSHSTKSYIKLNGVELNENGNVRSFKEIIKTEFGIDQNFLRLLRLGPNVANLINMKSTERKSFIASLLKDTEIYSTLYTKLSEDYRNMNSAINILSNKLVGLSAEKENDLKIQQMDYTDDIEETVKNIDKFKNGIASKEGENRALLQGKSVQIFRSDIELLKSNIFKMDEDIVEYQRKIDLLPDLNRQELSIEYGKTITDLQNTISSILKLTEEISTMGTERDKLNDILLINNSEKHLKMLQEKHDEIKREYELASSKLDGFSCAYNYSFLTNFVNTIADFQMSLDYLCLNDNDTINKLYKSDSSIIPWAKQRIQMLIGREINLKKMLSNIKFSAEYSSPIPLFRPPMCPTESCPFIKSHPEVIKLQSGDTRDSTVVNMTNEIAEVVKEIAITESYIEQYPKMQLLKKSWDNISLVLSRIGALKENNLFKILTNLTARTYWYDYNELLRVTELTKLQEDYFQIQTVYFQSSNELLKFENGEIANSKKRLEEINLKYTAMLEQLEDLNNSKVTLTLKKEELEKYIHDIDNLDRIKSELISLNLSRDNSGETLKRYLSILETVGANLTLINQAQSELAILTVKYNDLLVKSNKITMQLQDIASTKSSYNECLEDRNTLKLILDAVSSKDGIPLVLVKIFLDECREIINELIQDVFQDDLEILDFQISEETNEFKIPFISNGIYIDDIETASQGQQAIISIAMSFAICRKSMFDYNIPLLDEIDNSIYRHDREKFVNILFKQMLALGTEQVFLITHNDIFQQSGIPINVIMTTDEIIDNYKHQTIIRL